MTAELKAQFLRLYQMALTDGNFSRSEWKMLYEFAAERNISKKDLDNVILTTTGDLEVPKSIEKKLEYLYDFAVMAWADGYVSKDEIATLHKFCLHFGFLEENVEELSDYFLTSVKEGESKYESIKTLTA